MNAQTGPSLPTYADVEAPAERLKGIAHHTPAMSCAAPWHAGKAYALGWMRATLAMLNREA